MKEKLTKFPRPQFSGINNHLKTNFLTGLSFWFPIVMVLFVLGFVSGITGGMLKPIISFIPKVSGYNNIISIIMALALVYATGVIGRHTVGKKIISLIQSVPKKIPLVSTIYGYAQKITEVFSPNGANKLMGVGTVVAIPARVMSGIPRTATHPENENVRYGVLMSQFKGSFIGTCGDIVITEKEMANVFVPTPPFFHSGDLFAIPIESLYAIRICSHEDGSKRWASHDEILKIIGSAGAISPERLEFIPLRTALREKIKAPAH